MLKSTLGEMAEIFDSTLVAHRFFGRQGGVSTGIYESLNCGSGSDDVADRVIENKERCKNALGARRLITGFQTHSADVAVVNCNTIDIPHADALITSQKELAIGIMTADCMPVLFHDATNNIIGAAHAGWRGALGGILENTALVMEEHGADLDKVKVAFGPCLQRASFEVGEDLIDQFCSQYSSASKYFSPAKQPHKKLFDLVQFGMDRLIAKGILKENITSLGKCTLGEPDKYFSYRYSRQRSAADYGRNLSAICCVS